MRWWERMFLWRLTRSGRVRHLEARGNKLADEMERVLLHLAAYAQEDV